MSIHNEFVEPNRLGDVLKYEGDPMLTRESKTMTNPHSAAFTFVAGYPMDDNVPVANAGIAGIDGMLLSTVTLAANGEDGDTAKVAVLARGPAVFDKDALPTKDYAGTNFTLATVITKYAALALVVGRDEPDVVEEQTT
jgi:hypothetical protein